MANSFPECFSGVRGWIRLFPWFVPWFVPGRRHGLRESLLPKKFRCNEGIPAHSSRNGRQPEWFRLINTTMVLNLAEIYTGPRPNDRTAILDRPSQRTSRFFFLSPVEHPASSSQQMMRVRQDTMILVTISTVLHRARGARP